MAALKLKLEKGQTRTLYVIDIDDTLFESECKIYLKDEKTGGRIKALTPYEYNSYIREPGVDVDFDDFSNADLFIKTARPILPTLNKLVKIITKILASNKKDKIILLTSRPDFDDKNKILKYFENFGIPVHNEDLIQIVRCGNFDDKLYSTAEKKQAIVLGYILQNKFKNFIMWDDNIDNLKSFVELQAHAFKPLNFTIGHVVRSEGPNNTWNFKLNEVKNKAIDKYLNVVSKLNARNNDGAISNSNSQEVKKENKKLAAGAKENKKEA